jgi:general secretion pathway protein F
MPIRVDLHLVVHRDRKGSRAVIELVVRSCIPVPLKTECIKTELDILSSYTYDLSMPIYEYRGLSTAGKNVKGVVDASGVEAAREKLKARGLYLQGITEVTGRSRNFLRKISFSRRRTVSFAITRQLSFLLGAQLPIINALEGVIDQADDEEVKKMMIDIKEKIKEGKSISRAFADYPKYFSKMYVNTVHAGELSGKLDEVFRRLSSMFEKNRTLIAKLRSALTYPILMLCFAFVIIIFFVSFIVPTFAQLFADFEQTLPLPTRLLIGITTVLQKGWWAILILLIALFFIFRRVYRSEKGRLYFDSLALRLPVVKKLIQDTFRIRFSYTMSLMISSGIGIIEALEGTREIFRNRIFIDVLNRAIESVKKGEKLSRALSSNPVFNSSILGMIHAGEMGDRIPQVFDSIGQNIEVDLTERVQTLTSLAEPVIIVVIGVLIGFAILSIMLPIFQINQLFM